MSRWLDMARAEEKPSMTFANIANNANNPEIFDQIGAKVNIGNNVNWQTGLYGNPLDLPNGTKMISRSFTVNVRQSWNMTANWTAQTLNSKPSRPPSSTG